MFFNEAYNMPKQPFWKRHAEPDDPNHLQKLHWFAKGQPNMDSLQKHFPTPSSSLQPAGQSGFCLKVFLFVISQPIQMIQIICQKNTLTIILFAKGPISMLLIPHKKIHNEQYSLQQASPYSGCVITSPGGCTVVPKK